MQMMTHSAVESSRRFYGGLLNLHPREFRAEFGPSMLQLFTDQCRSAQREGGAKGLLLLWIRTLADLALSVLREHAASARSSGGLMEAVPGAPLPWKGVVLVMIPGLVFFIGQIGQLAGEDWFFLLVRRAAYYLIVPVVLVWVIKRKFPIWGLIPLGMLYRTLYDVGYRVESMLAENIRKIFESPASLSARLYGQYPPVMKALGDSLTFLKRHSADIRFLVTVVLLAAAAWFVFQLARRRQFSRAACAWTGVFVLLTLAEMPSGAVSYMVDFRWTLAEMIRSADSPSIWKDVSTSAYYYFTLDVGILLLVLAGVILARRHGRLALLLPLGYLMPTVVLGRFDNDPGVPFLLIWASISVLVYRAFVTLIAPVWIVRSASDTARRRAGAAGLMAAVAILLTAHIGRLVAGVSAYGWAWSLTGFYYSVSPELITLAGIALAVSLYRPVPSAPPSIPPDAAAMKVSDG
jgi:hypothetical protein